ncbi:hypothetical protein GGD81_003448 [Rhodobium orientis]|uniref:DUF6129 domain-containing protein n=1 Tax=Rhodobium orientis TaxID=34017 RepID=A0A327JK52_9HYPH|nr:DUF6129 family protein [Rhodobium orientis]MBB4304389.1 hypothetical protein [Rhodobium orientis]MBK5951995.1 hypothetical protein [Rhodobium orientis]RAI25774.1 hypothetical protein CH339_16840 [Rhodobium orientis]
MIADAEIDAIASVVAEEGPGDATVASLRQRWPDHHFTFCSDDDVNAARPVREADGFNLYLVTGSGGCISFTSSPESATGLVIAEVEEWDS